MSETADRTIPATPRRREQARRAGQEPTATLPAWAASAATAILMSPAWARSTIPAAAEAFREAATAALPGEAAAPLTLAFVMPSVGLIAASAAAGLAVHLATGGVSFQTSRAAFTPQRINPLSGLQRIFSWGTFLGMLGHALALSALVVVALMSSGPLAAMLSHPVEGSAFSGVAWQAIAWLAVAAASLATVQWFLARRHFEQRIMMTPQEFADEAKDLQADPRVKLLQQKQRLNRKR